MASADPEAGGARPGRKESSAPGGPGDIHRLSRCGNSLYELLDIPKESTHDEIRRKYKRLALKYHPDKNPDNPEAEEMFKKINHANSILSDEKKREIYDAYGSFGLYIADQFGDEVVHHVMLFSSKWFQCLFWSCCLITGCYFCCCGFCCCCCFCFGKCKPKDPEEDSAEVPDIAEFEQDDTSNAAGGRQPTTSQPTSQNATAMPMPPPASVSSGASEGKYDPRGTSDDVVVTSQPTKSSDPIVLGGPPLPPTTEAAGSPKRENSDEADESTALNNGDKVGYTTDMTSNTTPKKELDNWGPKSLPPHLPPPVPPKRTKKKNHLHKSCPGLEKADAEDGIQIQKSSTVDDIKGGYTVNDYDQTSDYSTNFGPVFSLKSTKDCRQTFSEDFVDNATSIQPQLERQNSGPNEPAMNNSIETSHSCIETGAEGTNWKAKDGKPRLGGVKLKSAKTKSKLLLRQSRSEDLEDCGRDDARLIKKQNSFPEAETAFDSPKPTSLVPEQPKTEVETIESFEMHGIEECAGAIPFSNEGAAISETSRNEGQPKMKLQKQSSEPETSTGSDSGHQVDSNSKKRLEERRHSFIEVEMKPRKKPNNSMY